MEQKQVQDVMRKIERTQGRFPEFLRRADGSQVVRLRRFTFQVDRKRKNRLKMRLKERGIG